MTIPSHLSFASVVEEGVPTAKEERRTPIILSSGGAGKSLNGTRI
jgi:hypothetical protein